MNKLLLTLTLFFIVPISLFAQSKAINGKVTDENGAPIPNVNVIEKKSKKGTQTDKDGNFSLSISNAAKVDIVFSSVAYTSKTVTVTGDNPIIVKLDKAAITQDEVVVIGYQTVKRKDLLSSVSSVGAKDLKDVPTNSAAEALNGRLAGVTATTAEGSPDADVTIRVRGGMSITGVNTPLYIVDGVQVENGLSSISPQDIQSIDVLKDASATAIYGARGGNGVIIITTKSGKPGKLRVSYNGFVGIKKLSNKLKVLSPYDYVFYQSERSRGSGTDSTSFLKNFGTTWDTLENYRNVSPVDWQSEVFGKTGITQTHNITGSGGTKKVVYNFGYTYNDDKAIVLNSSYKRHLFNVKGEYKITNALKIGLSTRYSHQDVLGAGVSSDQGSAFNRLRNAVKYRPFLSSNQLLEDSDPLADPNVGNGLNLENPIKLAGAEYRKKSNDVFNITANVSYDILKNLTFKSTFGYNESKTIDRQFSDSITPYSKISGAAKPIVRLDSLKGTTITNSNVLTYSIKDFKNKHDFDFLVGEETYELKSETRTSLFGKYPTFTPIKDALNQTSLGTTFAGYPRLGQTRYTSLSFFSRINYAYKDKYLLSANIRQDGASKFGPGNKWGTFPAVSFAWRVSKEKFMEKVSFINDLKFRVGFGSIGNNRIDDYLYITNFSNNGTYFYGLNNQVVNGYYSTALVNPDLKWESTVNRNFGMDITMLKRRIDLSIDYYYNTSDHLLLNVPVSSTYGYSNQLQNIGKSSNKGIEIQLNANIIPRKNNFSWNANFNFSSNKNIVEQLGVNQTAFFPAASWGVSGQPTDYIAKVGSPVGSMYGLVEDGFYKVDDFNYNTATSEYTLKTGIVTNVGIIGPVQPGSIKFKDLNGDGVIDLNNDRTIIGNPTPKFTGGLSQQFTYKNWDMSVFVNFSVGNDIYNANKIEFTNGYTGNSNLLDVMTDRWKIVTPTGATAQWVSGVKVFGIAPDQLSALNANAKIWQPLKSAGAFYPSSWAIEDGSFLRLNNVTIGYSLPVNSLVKMHMSKLRFYITANNLAIITNYTGYDPEVSVRKNGLTPGLDYSAYPKSKSFIFGINASF
jgi:TonB-dependent starch-binding outer membrane protein SusC